MDVAQLVVSSAAIIIPLLFGGWILRLYGEREKNWESQRALMDERLNVKDERLQNKDHQIQEMAELHGLNEKLLQKQLAEVQRRAGVDPEAPLSASAPAIPEESRQSMLEILGQLKDIRTAVEQLAPAAAPTTPTAEDYILRGYAYYQAGQYDDALAEFNHALNLRPDDPDTLTNRGVTLRQLKRYDDALADVNRALELRPDDADALIDRGLTLHHLKRYDEALVDHNRAIELRPDHPDTLMNRGVAFHHMERYGEALADYNRAIELRPDHPDTLINRGFALHNLERYDDALLDYNRALELRPDHAETLYNRACVYSAQNMAEEAVADLRRAIDGDAKHRAMARTDTDFDNIRGDPRFQELVGEEAPPAEGADG